MVLGVNTYELQAGNKQPYYVTVSQAGAINSRPVYVKNTVSKAQNRAIVKMSTVRAGSLNRQPIYVTETWNGRCMNKEPVYTNYTAGGGGTTPEGSLIDSNGFFLIDSDGAYLVSA